MQATMAFPTLLFSRATSSFASLSERPTSHHTPLMTQVLHSWSQQAAEICNGHCCIGGQRSYNISRSNFSARVSNNTVRSYISSSEQIDKRNLDGGTEGLTDSCLIDS
ncbi:hypothetical protein CC86DRAFT_419086 [Ophiobolus disseminans]|uniref:Uncharacterized protein n=1 Tax=Ophiobolus disseminans TaxID=1469910 RepID=A0A6A6ZY23_9PLEO|nr:hypothetical protein CC86DRAFT_419086 [Ophiobolus disseminans]